MFKVFKVNFQWEEKFLFFRHMDGHHKLVRWRMVIHGVACVAAFEREGKGSFRCERNARGARGGRERACQKTIAFLVFNIHQANVKILIGPSSKHVNHSLNTLIRLAEINITLLSNLIDLSVII